jgi:hypothetical protein
MLDVPEGVFGVNAAMPDAALGKCKLVLPVTLSMPAGGKSPLKPVFAVGELGQ